MASIQTSRCTTSSARLLLLLLVSLSIPDICQGYALTPSQPTGLVRQQQVPCSHVDWPQTTDPKSIVKERSPCSWKGSGRWQQHVLRSVPRNDEEVVAVENETPTSFVVQGGNPVAIVATQALLIPVAVVIAGPLQTPNYGFGPGIDFSIEPIVAGCVFTLPLAILAVALDRVEKNVPALQEVTKATQRAVISFLGSQFRPASTILAAVGIGLAAGFGEELLFRGVFQYGLVEQMNAPFSIAILVTAVVFGLLHAVTPLYAALAGLASVYFGSLYAAYGNLAIPIVAHAVYDMGALVYAHWEIGQKSPEELRELISSKPTGRE